MVLDQFYKLWKDNYQNLSVNKDYNKQTLELVDLGILLFNYEEELVKFGVKDPNYCLSI